MEGEEEDGDGIYNEHRKYIGNVGCCFEPENNLIIFKALSFKRLVK